MGNKKIYSVFDILAMRRKFVSDSDSTTCSVYSCMLLYITGKDVSPPQLVKYLYNLLVSIK